MPSEVVLRFWIWALGLPLPETLNLSQDPRALMLQACLFSCRRPCLLPSDYVHVLIALIPTGNTVPLWQATSDPFRGRENSVEPSRQGSRILFAGSHLFAGGLGESRAISSLPAAADTTLGLRVLRFSPHGPFRDQALLTPTLPLDFRFHHLSLDGHTQGR